MWDIDALRGRLADGMDGKVSAPGDPAYAQATAIWDKAEEAPDAYLGDTAWREPFRRFSAYAIKQGRGGDAPEHVGQVVLDALTAPKPRVRYVPVAGKLTQWTVPTRLPARVLDRLLGKQFGLLGAGNKRR